MMTMNRIHKDPLFSETVTLIQKSLTRNEFGESVIGSETEQTLSATVVPVTQSEIRQLFPEGSIEGETVRFFIDGTDSLNIRADRTTTTPDIFQRGTTARYRVQSVTRYKGPYGDYFDVIATRTDRVSL